ncbi:hypothetical protein TYRP_021339 [Tyrophagus putrescentiae]|nr:hypothetical protein TYRP_021339 [Tyrophagus putrescentiae]
MEDKENSNPIQSVSPSGEAAAVANVSNLELHKSSGNNLMQFNSPDEQQGEPKTADQLSTPPPPTTTTTTSGGQSPKRPVLKEISVDLFGLISPDRKFTAGEEEEEDKEGSPSKPGKASDLLSMSIFQTSPSTTAAAVTTTTDNQKVNISTASSGETVSTVEQMSATAQDTSSSILSTSLLFNQSTATQPCDGDDSSFISTQLLFNQSLNLSLNRSQEATPGNESGNDSNSTINKTMQLSVINSSTLLKNEIEFSVTYDNFESEAKDCDQETSVVVDDQCASPSVAPSTQQQEQQVNSDSVDSGASSLKDEDEFAVNGVQAQPVPALQDSALLETKLIYESKIVELNARIDELEEELQKKSQTDGSQPNDAQATVINETPFSMGDSVNLIQTEHDYESTIKALNERVHQLEEENRATKQKLTISEVAQKKESSSSNAELQQQTSMVQGREDDLEMTFTLEDRLSLLDTKVAYEKRIVDLEEKVEELESQKPDSSTIVSDDSFIIDKQLVEQLLDTKLVQENEIEQLKARLAQLTTQVAECEGAKEQQLREELKTAKQHHEADRQQHEEQMESKDKEIESLTSRLAGQDAHYQTLLGEMEAQVAELKSKETECREEHVGSLVPKYEILLSQYQELSLRQQESEGANQQLLANITDMDEQRNALRRKLERASEQAALQAEQLEAAREQLAAAVERQLKSVAAETTALTRLEQLEVAQRILSEDLSARDDQCARLEAENGQLKTQLAQSELDLREAKALEEVAAQLAGQQLKEAQEEVGALRAEQLTLQENISQLQAANGQLSEAKDALAVAQAGQLTAEAEAKKALEEQLTASECLAKRLQESLCAEQQARDTLLLPAKEKLTESVEKFTKMSASLSKLIAAMKTNRDYKETVPSDIVKKILYNVRYKVNSTVVESSQVLGLQCDIVLPPVAVAAAATGDSKKTTSKVEGTEEEEEVHLSDDISPLVVEEGKGEAEEEEGTQV